NMPIQYVNPAFEQTTGWKLEEVIGKNCRFLQGHDTEQEGLKQLRVAMKAGEPCTVVLRNFRKDGTMFWNELSISPVQDEYGDVTHYVGVQNDIGDRGAARGGAGANAGPEREPGGDGARPDSRAGAHPGRAAEYAAPHGTEREAG
ncbi:MAG: PAS domain-containing protein, partial [Sphingobacteriia bacterium]